MHKGRQTAMTLPAHAEEFRLPSADEREGANQLRKLLAAHLEHDAKLKIFEEGAKAPVELVLAPALSETLIKLLRYLSQGDAVTLIPINRMLTTTQAADILNVSRPYMVSLLEKGHIRYELVGRHRRVKAEDLFAYKRGRDKERSKALDALAALDAETL
jgi:excisionase family DNA binding protein